jgi:hypothetical protein
LNLILPSITQNICFHRTTRAMADGLSHLRSKMGQPFSFWSAQPTGGFAACIVAFGRF